jgi:hypothetical protein
MRGETVAETVRREWGRGVWLTRVGSCAAVTLWMSAAGWGLRELDSCASIASSPGAFGGPLGVESPGARGTWSLCCRSSCSAAAALDELG